MDPDDGRVVSNFICQALRGDKLTLYGNGEQSRSFCYVDDLIAGVVAMGQLKSNPRTPINLGNPNEFTVLTLALAVIEKVYGDPVKCGRGVDGWFQNRPMPIDDPRQRCPDIKQAQAFLNWRPKVELKQGLDMTIDHFRKVIKAKQLSLL
jgi:UDP-glucuronate decarboxylase